MVASTSRIASLFLIIGALLVSADSAATSSGRRTPKASHLRSHSSRKLYDNNNYNNNNNNYNGYNGAYGGNYGGNYGANDDGGNAANDDADEDNGNGDNYVDYSSNYGNDDASYYNANQNYKADGSSYNGRDQSWGGQSVQTYSDDDEEIEFEVETYSSHNDWMKFGGLSGSEALMMAGLVIVIALSVIFMLLLANGFNVIQLYQQYCGSQKDTNADETVDDGFVKLDDDKNLA